MSIKFENPNEFPTPENVKEIYDKLRPIGYDKRPIEKVSFENIGTDAYIWKTYKKILNDDLDKEFVLYPDKFKVLSTIFGYSDHSNYPLIFRRILLDYIKIGAKKGVFDKLDEIDAIYITTVPCNIYGNYCNTVSDCYDEYKGHLTKTMFFIKKDNVQTVKVEDDDDVPKKRMRTRK